MVVPIAVRSLAAVAGGALVIVAWASAIGTLIVPRQGSGWLTRWTDRIVNRAFRAFIAVAGAKAGYWRRDRMLRPQGAAILIGQFVAWLGISYIGFTLLMWPFMTGGITRALTVAGGSMTTVGFSEPAGTVPPVIVFAAAVSSLVIIAPQIAYLPALYAAYSRRETEVALLNAWAGAPSWGPELLARTQYELGSGVPADGRLPGLYAQWERWAIDVGESHSAYLPLVRFRSSRSLTSWVTALLAVLDSAALFLALAPESAPAVPARNCLRSGFFCFTHVAEAMGFDVSPDPGPGGISLSYQEFLAAVTWLRQVDFPIERDPADAWPDFAGWRVNYEQAAYALAFAVDAVPALWSAPAVTAPPPSPRPGRRSASRPANRPANRAVGRARWPSALSPSCLERHIACGLRRTRSRRNGEVTHSYPPAFAARRRATTSSIISAAMPASMARSLAAARLPAWISKPISGSWVAKKPSASTISRPASRPDRGRRSTVPRGTPARSITSCSPSTSRGHPGEEAIAAAG
jgi:hypothetical protein